MTKKYTAKSHVSLTVVFESGASKHISFNQITSGGSVYYSNSEDEQKALENHRWYGRLFKCAEGTIPSVEAQPVAPNGEEKKEAVASAETKPIEVNVPSVNDAKEYIADRYGVSRSKLRSKVAIEAEALKHNIVFVGI